MDPDIKMLEKWTSTYVWKAIVKVDSLMVVYLVVWEFICIYSAVNSLTGTGAYTRHFFDELHWRLTIYVNIRTPTTYLSDYESSAFWLQHRFINHPRSSEYEGAVPLRKSCLFGPFYFLYNIVQYAFFSITVNRPWRPPDPPAASWCLIWSTSSSKDSYWSPLSAAEGLGPRVQGDDIQNCIALR